MTTGVATTAVMLIVVVVVVVVVVAKTIMPARTEMTMRDDHE